MIRTNVTLLTGLMAAGLAVMAMALLAWRRRAQTPGGSWLIVDLFAIAEILIAYALSYSAVLTPVQIVWLINITYVGWLVMPLAFVVYIARLTGRDRWLTTPVWVVLVVFPSLLAIAIWGPNGDAWFFGGGRSMQTFDFPASSPLYWGFLLYSYALLAVAATLIVSTARRSSRLHPVQVGLLIAMSLLPWILSFASFFNVRVLGADPTVLSLVVVGVLAFSVTQFRTFDLRPMTEAEAHLASEAGVVVVDRRGRLTEMNATAARLLGPGVSPAMGRQLEQIWASEPAIVAALHGADLGGIQVHSASGNALLDFEYSRMTERNGRYSGTLILIRERAGARAA